jgi:hypothetical protein
MTVGDSRLLSTFTGTGIDTTGLNVNQPIVSSGANLSATQIGTSFTLIATTINTLFGSTLTSLTTTINVIGRDSGARLTIPLTITKTQ